MPKIGEKEHGVFYGHGTVREDRYKANYNKGKTIILYGPPKTTLADEVAKYVILYLQDPENVQPLQVGDLARISTPNYKEVRRRNPLTKEDDLSPELWKAATRLNDYPRVVSNGDIYPDVSIGPLESVSFYSLCPVYVTEFNHKTWLSEAMKQTAYDVVHVTTCQATSYNDDLILLRPDLSDFAFKTRVISKLPEVKYEQTLEELIAQKTGTQSQSQGWSPFGGFKPQVDPFANMGRSTPGLVTSSFGSSPFGGGGFSQPSSTPFGGPSFMTQPSATPFGGQSLLQGGASRKMSFSAMEEEDITPPGPKWVCLVSHCKAFVPWEREMHRCPKCNDTKNYQVRYVCRNQGCPAFERGQSEYRKTNTVCQYCGGEVG